MKFEYSKMNLELDCDYTPHNDEILKELNRLGLNSWLLVSPLSFCDTGRGTQICSGIIVRTVPKPQIKEEVPLSPVAQGAA